MAIALPRKVFLLIAIASSSFLVYFALPTLPTNRISIYFDQDHFNRPWIEYTASEDQPETPSETPLSATNSTELVTFEKVLVVARTRIEDIDWINQSLSDWKSAVYTVDDPEAPLHTTGNKGHEASVYLTYIIENYYNLPSIVVFIHSHQKHKHGTRDIQFEGIDYDNIETIRALKLDFVKKIGYANLRCMANPGCPAEIQPFRPAEERDPLRPQEAAMSDAWKELFGDDESDVPRIIAAPCCGQFAVSKEQILERRKDEYERYLKWLYDTPLDDFTSGRIFEYLWHIIFGKSAVYCPDENQCYQDQYGVTAPVLSNGSNNKRISTS